MSEAVRIRAIASGGDGVGTLEDGRTVFVPRSAPGDLLETEIALVRQRSGPTARAISLRLRGQPAA